MRPLQQVLIALGLYAAFLVDVAIHACAATAWTPNLLLLVVFTVTRNRGGIFWATIAGALCDALCDRPLGVTMLVAALTATVMREALPKRPPSALWNIAQAFAFVAAVEVASRLLANSVVERPEPLATAFAVAATSSLCIAAGTLAISFVARVRGGSVRRPASLQAIPSFR